MAEPIGLSTRTQELLNAYAYAGYTWDEVISQASPEEKAILDEYRTCADSGAQPDAAKAECLKALIEGQPADSSSAPSPAAVPETVVPPSPATEQFETDLSRIQWMTLFRVGASRTGLPGLTSKSFNPLSASRFSTPETLTSEQYDELYYWTMSARWAGLLPPVAGWTDNAVHGLEALFSDKGGSGSTSSFGANTTLVMNATYNLTRLHAESAAEHEYLRLAGQEQENPALLWATHAAVSFKQQFQLSQGRTMLSLNTSDELIQVDPFAAADEWCADPDNQYSGFADLTEEQRAEAYAAYRAKHNTPDALLHATNVLEEAALSLTLEPAIATTAMAEFADLRPKLGTFPALGAGLGKGVLWPVANYLIRTQAPNAKYEITTFPDDVSPYKKFDPSIAFTDSPADSAAVGALARGVAYAFLGTAQGFFSIDPNGQFDTVAADAFAKQNDSLAYALHAPFMFGGLGDNLESSLIGVAPMGGLAIARAYGDLSSGYSEARLLNRFLNVPGSISESTFYALAASRAGIEILGGIQTARAILDSDQWGLVLLSHGLHLLGYAGGQTLFWTGDRTGQLALAPQIPLGDSAAVRITPALGEAPILGNEGLAAGARIEFLSW